MKLVVAAVLHWTAAEDRDLFCFCLLGVVITEYLLLFLKICFSSRWKSSTSLQNKCRKTQVSAAKGWDSGWVDIFDTCWLCRENPCSF